MVGGGLQKLAFYIFDIRICPSCIEQIYSIFAFGQVPRNKYIRYTYSVKLVETNIFVFGISYLIMNIFDIRIR